MLEARGLKKAYGYLQAVDGVSFSVKEGEILGLLGPNGAGKTTTVSMVAGILVPDEGEVLIDGSPIAGDTDSRKRSIGLVPQEIALFDRLSADDNLRFFGALYGLSGSELDSAVGRALDYAGLRDRAKDRVKTFSGGMKRRLNLAAGLLHGPGILLLDEPTVGVDPQSRNSIFDNLENLRDEGLALLYTTHYMEEAERLCDRVVIIDHGRVLADDAPRALCTALSVKSSLSVEFAQALSAEAVGGLEKLEGVVSVKATDSVAEIDLERMDVAPKVLEWFSGKGLAYTSVRSRRADLEAVFLNMTGRKLRD